MTVDLVLPTWLTEQQATLVELAERNAAGNGDDLIGIVLGGSVGRDCAPSARTST